MSVDAVGFAADPARLRDAAGRTGAAGRAVADAAAEVATALDAAGAACGGPRLAEALAGFGQELRMRAGLLGEAVGATAMALDGTAEDYEASDRAATGLLRAPGGLEGTMFGGVLG